MRWLATTLTLGLLVGCTGAHDRPEGEDGGSTTGDGGSPTADGGSPTSDGGPADCNAPDTECPDLPPVTGGPCEGDLSCDYDDGSLAQCVDGHWNSYGCPGCAPPLAEGCRPPFDGTLEGAGVQIGPYSPTDAFRPFTDGERISPVFGAQGGSMVEFQLSVDHATPPSCAAVTANVSLDGVASAPATFPVRLHCGSSLRVLVILPDNPCEERDYAVDLDVEVAGVGSTSVSLVLGGSACPGPAG